MATLTSRISGSGWIPAFAVAAEDARAQFERRRRADPDLPVGEEASSNCEAVCKLQVCRNSPDRERARDGRRGSEQGPGRERQAAVSAAPFPEFRALREPDPDNHGRLTNLTAFA